MIKVGIVGDGYTSEELNRLLAVHPQARVVGITSIENVGRRFAEVFPNLEGYTDVSGEKIEIPGFFKRCDALFIALPHGLAAPLAKEALAAGIKVIDLGADFRFRSRETYEHWYHTTHPAPELLERAVYGLPELYREEVRRTDLTANPGCYPTGAILGLTPALASGLLDPDTLIVDSKSGVSGAGRTPVQTNIFCEVNENVRAYNVGVHRHGPEIEQILSRVAGREVLISFTPHLIPMTRGILSTIYGRLARPVAESEVREIYREFYRESPFVKVLPEGQLPMTKAVYSSNHCHIGMVPDERTGRLVIVTAIDNLVKGASGQAVQNLNLMFGLPETDGLNFPGVLP
ncbi:MAG: N-acetyl-gamma-glutamyl-phosphate reductase [Firmicutes bacterium]|nr:N-acetyl-gamma-glutamyl-phosphate reductase [Bacillota bacterium]